MTEIQKQKPYFYLKSKNEKLDDMIVREVKTTNDDSRYFHIVFTYGKNDEIIKSCYPNGITFTCFKSKQELSEYAAKLIKKQHGDIKDSQIKAIRLCKLLKPLEHSDDLMPNTEIQVSSNFKVFKEWIVGNAKE